ncbi:hypothetical protein DPMN_041270 [Dreissena polymorpha]|uniref:Uncharacterized protein n=1 Tax=Dreissena polymorpha TaxID=45954 RepID=A0A9D4CWI4_DREPO|nr:hypothetical protein DPMN_041270 [Dreissena polymorpha]
MMLISGIGPKLARVIVQLRQGSGNLDLDSLEVLIGRPLSDRELDQLDFAENPMLAAASQASGSEEEHPSRSRAPGPMFVSRPDEGRASLSDIRLRGGHHSMGGVPGDMERLSSPVCKAFVPQTSVVSVRSCGGDRHADTV